MKPAGKDIATGALLCAFAVSVYVAAPYTVDDFDDTVLTPLSFPLALSALIAVMSALLVFNGWRQRAAARASTEAAERAEDPPVRSAWHLAGAMAAMAVYVGVLPLLGYMLATGVVLLVLSFLYGNRSWPGMLVVAVVVPPAVFYFFERVMIILLPSSSLL